ncbi:MAG: ABC transporter permease subunit, partial [Isosphaeraceae bacterium]
DEKQRKTLHYLMASQLSSAEIVLDKVLGRLPHLGVFLAMGLPIVSILGLIGGISADHVLIAYVGTCSTATFAVALTVLVSTLSRGVRSAIVTSYVLVLGWLLLPPMITLFGSMLRPAIYFWVSPVNDWLTASSPLGVWYHGMMRRAVPFVSVSLPVVMLELEWMVKLQLGGAFLLLLIAIWRLRPTFRRQEETPARRTWFGGGRGRSRRKRRFERPACGDDAILWKERYFAPSDLFTRMVILPAIVAVTFPLAMITEFHGDFSAAIQDLWRHGWQLTAHGAENLAWALQVDLGWYTALWLLAVGGACASSVSIEREEDTWVSLTATPLTGWEIVRAKALGAIWNQRGFGAVMIFLWTVGLVTGAVYPPGVLASIAIVAVLTWLVAAVGIHASLRASSTSRSIASTIVALGLFNGYQFTYVIWFLGGVWLLGRVTWNSSFSMLGGMPMLAAGPMVPHRFATQGTWRMTDLSSVPASVRLPFALILLTIYVLSAILLTIRVIKGFDRWLDRPPLSDAGWPETGIMHKVTEQGP